MPVRPSQPDPFHLDPRAVRRSFDAASGRYDAAAAVQSEIRSRLLERLSLVRIEPAVVIDLGAGTGAGSRALEQRYPSARVIAMDSSQRMLAAARRHQSWWRKFDRIAGEASSLPLQTGSADLVFSNLMLHWCNEPDGVFSEIHRVLRPRGLLTFTTLGPDTLKELREAWQHADLHVHVNRFIDMHDLGDALMRAGFAEPVMDTERLTVTYASVERLMEDLKRTGSHNVNAGRRRGLTAARTLAKVQAQLETRRREGVLPATVEVVYGHAWAGEPRVPRAASGEVRIPLREVRRRD